MPAELPQSTRQTIQQQGGLSSDTRALMLFQANKKTALVAYCGFSWGCSEAIISISNAPASRLPN